MFTLIIGDTETVVKNDKITASWELCTANFLGDVIEILEKHFPNYDKDATTLSDAVIKHIKTELDGEKSVLEGCTIFGEREVGVSMLNIPALLKDKTSFKPSLREVEKMRLECGMSSAAVLYDESGVKDGVPYESKGVMMFKNLSNVTEIFVAYLYFCAFNDLRLVRCKHCGLWFATPSLEFEYCTRTSPCYNRKAGNKVMLGRATKNRSCFDATTTMKQALRSRRECICKNWQAESGSDEEAVNKRCNDLRNTCYNLLSKINQSPTADNFAEAFAYLYSDEMPKQKRPNRKKSTAKGN